MREKDFDLDGFTSASIRDQLNWSISGLRRQDNVGALFRGASRVGLRPQRSTALHVKRTHS